MIDLINKIVLHICYRCGEDEEIRGIEHDCEKCLLSEVIDEIKSIPSIIVNNGSHGEWIKHEIEDTVRWVECSECHREYPNIEMNFCPNCGKWMKDGDSDRPHGKWIQIDPIGEFKCSECGWTMVGTHKFCPNCGADMRVYDDEKEE